jgi:hypothetical protein
MKKKNVTLKAKKTGRGWGQGGEMNQALYAHKNNKRKIKKKKANNLVTFLF